MKQIDPGKRIEVDPDTLTGEALNWAAFVALFSPVEPSLFEVEVSIVGDVTFPGGRFLAYSNGYETVTWEPVQNSEQADKLIDGFLIASRKVNSTWYAIASAELGTGDSPSWSKMTARGGKRYGAMSYEVHRRQQRFGHESRLIASLRAAVAHHAYLTNAPVVVPEILIEGAK